MIRALLFILLGLLTGTISGLVGIGGGIVIIPILVFVFGFTQAQAQGTTLALMVPPIGFLAAYTYYRSGLVNLPVAALVCIGFFLGGLVGSKIAVNVPNVLLQKFFGGVMIVIGLYMLLKR